MGTEDCRDSKTIHEEVTEQRMWDLLFEASASLKHPWLDILSADSAFSFLPKCAVSCFSGRVSQSLTGVFMEFP